MRVYLNKGIKLLYGVVLLIVGHAWASQSALLNIQHWRMKNGAKVYFVRASQLPILDVDVVFAAGSAFDGHLLGLANFVNSMIGEGGKNLNADQIAEAFDAVGAQFDTNIDRDKAVVVLRTLTKEKYLQPALATFHTALALPNFPDNALSRVRNQIIAAIKVNQQKPAKVASRAFYQAVYSGQLYAHDPLGTIESVAQLSKNEILQFYRRFYVTRNADVILVGDITRQQAEKISDQIMQGLPEGKSTLLFVKAPALTHAKNIHIPFPSEQTTILIGQVGITRENPNYFPLIVGNQILGGLNLTSMLFKKIREEKGFAYYVSSNFIPLRFRGPFVVTLQTKASQTQSAIQLVRQVLQHFLQKGPSVTQLNEAKRNLIGSFPLALASNKKVAAVLINMAFYNRPLDFLDQYRGRVAAVNQQQIKKAFAKEINLNKMVTVTVGPS